MIVIKEKDAVYFASPMKYQNFYTQAKLDYSFEENGDIWHLNDEHGTIVMAAAKNNRIVDLLRYSDVFDCEFSKDGMNQIVANIKKLIKGTNCFISEGKLGLTLCVARGNKGYKITTYGAVFEIGDIECFDESEERMLAAYEYCKSIPDVHQRIETIYNQIGELSWSQYYPIAVINTKDESYSLLTNK